MIDDALSAGGIAGIAMAAVVVALATGGGFWHRLKKERKVATDVCSVPAPELMPVSPTLTKLHR